VDDVPDRERLEAGAAFHKPIALAYEALLERMLDSQSDAVRELTAYHIGELRLVRFQKKLEALLERGAGADVRLALSRLKEEVPVAQ